MTHDRGDNNIEDISFESDIQKAGYTNGALATPACLSFNRELSLVFGHDSSMSAVDDARTLSKLKSIEVWDDRNEYRSRHNSAEKRGDCCYTTLTAYVNGGSGLSQAGQNLKIACLTASKDVITQLFSWMTNTHSTGKTNGGDSATIWQYISHSVRKMFVQLHLARASVRTPDGDITQLVWGFLQGKKLAEALILAKFKNHRIMSHVLNHHIRATFVANSDFKRSLDGMQNKMDAANSNANESKQIVDCLVTKVSKIK